jgi:hypothetical protein
MLCDKLTAIRQGEQKWGTRERRWYPYPHDNPDGKPCEGDKKEIK